MATPHFPWKRFWCPRGGNFVIGDSGFLFDPESEYGSSLNAAVVPFDQIAPYPCLVLLGEPGIGKTTALEEQRAIAQAETASPGERVLYKDLKRYQTDAALVRSLFEDPCLRAWQEGSGILQLFLDSFDECLSQIQPLAAMLADELVRLPVKRLRLRIASRTAVWPKLLEEALSRLWGEDAVGVYELVPLRRRDVAAAACTVGVDSAAFLGQIDRRDAAALAMKPVTLNFLLNIFRLNGSFPATQEELYLQGCERLCEETSESRRAAGRTGLLDARRRLTVAARVAGVTQFCGRPVIWTGADDGSVPEGDVRIIDLLGGSESSAGSEFEVTEPAVREVLDTGLFTSRGPGRLGFAHQTYAEFLAAHYVQRRGMPIEQLEGLLLHPEDRVKVIPQLHETTAWLAGLVPAVFERVIDGDPQVLLGSDAATMSAAARERLVAGLLRLMDAGTITDSQWDLRRRYGKLDHPRLADQLVPYIRDRGTSIMVRRVAIDIAEACHLRVLQALLGDTALDPAEEYHVRVQAAYALMRIGDDDAKLRLKPCLSGAAGPDPEDELKGCALQALWPAQLTAEELLQALTVPRQPGFFGAYRQFLWGPLSRPLPLAALPAALTWVAEHARQEEDHPPLRELRDTFLRQGWVHLGEPGVLPAFAVAAYLRLDNHLPLPARVSAQENPEDAARRHTLVEPLVLLLAAREGDPRMLLFTATPQVGEADVPWMLARLLATDGEDQPRIWAKAVAMVYSGRNVEHLEAILDARKRSAVLAAEFAPYLDPVELGSARARQLKKQFQESVQWQARLENRQRPPLSPPPAERMQDCLAQFEAGNLEFWWRLTREMTLKLDSTHYGIDVGGDITTLPGWEAAGEATRRRIVAAATSYLAQHEPTTADIDKGTFDGWIVAGCKALYLLAQADPKALLGLPTIAWQRWTPLLMAFPAAAGFSPHGPRRALLRLAYEFAPEEYCRTLAALIDKDNRERDQLFHAQELSECCWDARIARMLLTKLHEGNLKPALLETLLTALLAHGCAEARAYAGSLIALPAPLDGEQRTRAVAAAAALFCHAQDGGWAAVWPAVEQDSDFGREVVMQVAHMHDQEHTAQLAMHLTEGQIAELYAWLVRQFPPADDETHGGGWVSRRDSVAWFRDALLDRLQHRGTQAACRALDSLIVDLPEARWLRWTAVEARRIMLHKTWLAPAPAEFLRMVRESDTRLVVSGEQLLRVIVESLGRLERELQGETPGAPDLWDKVEKNLFRPKDENHLSNYIARHLRRDIKARGVVVNREVEIRRGEGDAQGERTDIHVDALTPGARPGAYDQLSMVIEVKGCWNAKLMVDMEKQLRDRYLKDSPCRHGLYLVGWFLCPQWDADDRRRSQVPRRGRDALLEALGTQARQLSGEEILLSAFVLNAALR
jgi:hypothetical protein